MTAVAIFKSAIAAEIEGAIYFREGTAERFPDDDRNQRCVERLRALSKNIDELPDDDSTLRSCFDLYRSKHQAAGNIDAGYAWLDGAGVPLWFPKSSVFESEDKTVFTRYGFDAKETGDAEEFMAGISSEIEGWEPDELRLDE